MKINFEAKIRAYLEERDIDSYSIENLSIVFYIPLINEIADASYADVIEQILLLKEHNITIALQFLDVNDISLNSDNYLQYIYDNFQIVEAIEKQQQKLLTLDIVPYFNKLDFISSCILLFNDSGETLKIGLSDQQLSVMQLLIENKNSFVSREDILNTILQRSNDKTYNDTDEMINKFFYDLKKKFYSKKVAIFLGIGDKFKIIIKKDAQRNLIIPRLRFSITAIKSGTNRGYKLQTL